MSAVEALQAESPKTQRPTVGGSATGDFTWRVLILLNLFRLTVGVLLLVIYYFVEQPRIVGETDPNLAWAALLGMLVFGCVELLFLQRRFPNARTQTVLQFAADLTAMTILIHASGGISSGLGGMLVISVGTLALTMRTDRAFLLSSVAALALLVEQTLAHWQGMTTAAQYAPAGIL